MKRKFSSPFFSALDRRSAWLDKSPRSGFVERLRPLRRRPPVLLSTTFTGLGRRARGEDDVGDDLDGLSRRRLAEDRLKQIKHNVGAQLVERQALATDTRHLILELLNLGARHRS